MGIMVIGATGQLGRHLCAQLGADAIAITRNELTFSDSEPSDTIGALLHRHTPDAVINAAAYTQVAAAEDDEAYAIHCNATIPGILAQQCATKGITFVHGSTDYVFDGEKGAPYAESDATYPINAYGRSKLAGEKAVMALHPNAIILRYSWLYDATGTGFFARIRTLAAQQDTLRIVADQIGTPTYAGDAARMTLAALHAGVAGGMYHAASCGHTSWHGFACHAVDTERTHIMPILAREYVASVARPRDSRLDSAKLARAAGVAIPHWREGLARCKEVAYAD
jgi:dTDP-4-dehydrorhamnose reductase